VFREETRTGETATPPTAITPETNRAAEHRPRHHRKFSSTAKAGMANGLVIDGRDSGLARAVAQIVDPEGRNYVGRW
jgi:hypothetical protein